MQIRGIVFDLDGTLVDSLQDIASACNEVLTSRDYPAHSLADYRQLVGSGVTELFRRAIPAEQVSDRRVEQCVRDFYSVYPRHLDRHTAPYPGIVQLLAELRQRKLRLAVLSNKPQPFTSQCVSHCLPPHTFAPVLGQSRQLARKPDPAGALEIVRSWNLQPAEVAMVGDSSVDMQTATAAGLRPIGVAWGFRSRDELQQHGAADIICSPPELLRCLNE